jgi:hypothetical protein
MAVAAWFILLIVLLLLIFLAAGAYFYNLAVSRRKKSFLSASSDLGNFSDTWGGIVTGSGLSRWKIWNCALVMV